MLLTKEVEVGLKSQTIKWYEEKGYKIPRRKDKQGKLTMPKGTKIVVKVEDLTNGSGVKVVVQCDKCGEILTGVKWRDYLKCVKEDGSYYCNKCATLLFSVSKSIKTRIKNGKSFYQWCYDTLPKELADYILSRWDYEKNKCSPKDVSFSSNGIDSKGYWFKCSEHPEHESELKSINSFTSNRSGSLTCNQCSTISITHPHLIKYLVNEEDAYNCSIGVHKEILAKCPDCGFIKKTILLNLMNTGLSCPRCSDGIPYPEKFLFNFLEQLNLIFITQLNKKTFEWCKKYKYDNFIERINCIIETHGTQHYEEVKNFKKTLNETQENDFDKEWLARLNNIKNYIILDCRKSEMIWIKNSIMKSRLSTLLDFIIEDIDWLKCHEFACSSLVKSVCDLWNNGIKNTKIANKLKINTSTVRNYLKQGVELGWGDYNAKEEGDNNLINIHKENSKQVICITTNEIFKSQTNASKKYYISPSGISSCCNGKQKSAGKHPETGEKLKWMYYDEYILLNK